MHRRGVGEVGVSAVSVVERDGAFRIDDEGGDVGGEDPLAIDRVERAAILGREAVPNAVDAELHDDSARLHDVRIDPAGPGDWLYPFHG